MGISKHEGNLEHTSRRRLYSTFPSCFDCNVIKHSGYWNTLRVLEPTAGIGTHCGYWNPRGYWNPLRVLEPGVFYDSKIHVLSFFTCFSIDSTRRKTIKHFFSMFYTLLQNMGFWPIKFVYIEDITRWREHMIFYFRVEKIYFKSERSERVKSFFPREDKLHMLKPTCNFLFITKIWVLVFGK